MERLLASVRNAFAGFWLLPALIGVGFALAAALVLTVDHAAGRDGVGIGFGGDAAAARSLLTLVAGSLITVTGLTFSLTVVTLQLVSGQFTPRALRGLLSDRVTQVLAGTFVGIVVYSLIVLRSVRDREADGSGGFVPQLATTVASIATLAALGLLLYFVHHIGRTIQVSSISARIYEQTLAAIDRLYPEGLGEPLEDDAARVLARWRAEGEPLASRPRRAGYVQAVAIGDLVASLAGSGARIVVAVQPGDLVSEETIALEIWGAPDAERAKHGGSAALVIDDERDIRQDVAFGLRQLADIALRALSPGVNDPTTAVTCIGYGGAALQRLAGREMPARLRRYEDEDVTVIASRVTFEDLVELSVVELGRFATADARVGCALLDALTPVAVTARRAGATDRVATVVAAARRIATPMLEDARTAEDRALLLGSLGQVESAAA